MAPLAPKSGHRNGIASVLIGHGPLRVNIRSRRVSTAKMTKISHFDGRVRSFQGISGSFEGLNFRRLFSLSALLRKRKMRKRKEKENCALAGAYHKFYRKICRFCFSDKIPASGGVNRVPKGFGIWLPQHFSLKLLGVSGFS